MSLFAGAERRSPALCAALLLIALPAAVFYVLLFLQQSPLPLQDDYSALLHFAVRWRETASLHGKAVLFLRAQDGDYKLYFDHICTLVSLAVLRRVGVLSLCWLGNLLWIAVAWLLWHHTRIHEGSTTRRLLLFAPACFLLFQLNSAETFNWAMAGLQNLGVVCFAMAAIACLLQAETRFDLLALLLSLAAVCASANGFLLLPIAVAMLLMRRQRLLALLFTIALIAALFIYRWHLHVEPKRIASPMENLLYAINFLGGAVESIRGKPFHGAAAMLGFVMVAATVVLVVRGMRSRNPFLFWTVMWALLTTALVAAGRAGGPLELARSGRYKIYSDLVLAVLYLDAASLLAKRFGKAGRAGPIYLAALTATCLMCAVSDREGYLFLQSRRAASEIEFLRAAAPLGTDLPLPPQELPQHTGAELMKPYIRFVLHQSIVTGVYRLPARDILTAQ